VAVELEQMGAAVRPRTPWEAMDLGLHMVRRWWKAILGPWLLTVGSFTLAVVLPLQDSPFLAFLLFWLCKPLYDRVPLFVLSQALFGATPRWRETIQALPGLLGRDLPWTFVHRISLIRSFTLPVRQLEQLRGARARQRTQVLHRQGRSHAAGLTGLFLLLEAVGWLSLLWLVPMLLPQDLSSRLVEHLFETGAMEGWLAWVFTGAYIGTVLLLEPFYLAAGFALYLNRRTQLEAWDVELRFRLMRRRLQRVPRAALGLTLIVCTALWSLPEAPAAEPPEPPPVHPELRPEQDAKQVIETVMEDPLFEVYREITRWEFVSEPEEEEDTGELPDLGIGRFLARLTEAALWGGLLVGLGTLVAYRKRWMPVLSGPRRKKARPIPPRTLFGLDLRPESLPDDIPGAALERLATGDARGALGLLYRGALVSLVHRRGVPLIESDTEGECLSKLRREDQGPLYEHLRALTRAWQEIAYAHQSPGEAHIGSLARAWTRHYGASG
jgi:hypothetical protein